MESIAVTAIVVYLVCVNVIAFAAFGVDKVRARRGAWRIPEKTLIVLAVIGGSVGALAGMHVFHHKTRKAPFSKGIPAIFAVQLLLAAALLAVRFMQDERAPEMQVATISYIVDGDTVDVLVDGKEERVRLIGIDAPESANHDETLNTAEGAQSSEYLRSWLAGGTTVYLEADAEDRDRYGRLLRYIWLEQPTDPKNIDETASKMVNARIVADGYADAMRYEPNTRYAHVFETLERTAISQGRGVSYLWS